MIRLGVISMAGGFSMRYVVSSNLDCVTGVRSLWETNAHVHGDLHHGVLQI